MRMRAKPVNQGRSRQKRDRILAAMESLLRKKPFSAIGVADLAAKARVPPATIYQRFSNRDVTASVLLELYFLRVEEWASRSRDNGATRPAASLLDALRMIARDALEQAAELGHIMRPAYLYSRQRPDLAGGDWARLEKLALDGFRAFLERRADQIRVRDPDKAAAVLCYLYNFMLLGPLLHDDASPGTLLKDPEQFASELATLAYRYLTCADDPGESES
jgi:AcrR family transcriptional regulator